MQRRALVSAIAAACVSVLAVIGVVAATGPAEAATNTKAFFTLYGWYDNTPPSAEIAYPSVHDEAGGTGTYNDPLTFAAATGAAKPGTKIWVPRLRKYFVMEDGCDECDQDWNGKGPNGGPKLYHFDLWLGGKGGDPFDAINCEDALTHYNADGSATLEDVVIDPPSNEPYDPTPIFDLETGACYGGAKPNTLAGAWVNKSTGYCLTAPSTNPANGSKLSTSPCNGSATQNFTFQGAFMIMARQCATISGSNLVFQPCDAGPKQQFSVNLNNSTISDIQTSKKCFRDTNGTLTAGSCSGVQSQWTFPTGSTPPPSTPPPSTPPGGNKSYEGESATLAGGTTVTSCAHCSGGKKLSFLVNGSSATLTGISEPADGSYTLKLYFMSVGRSNNLTLTVNGVSKTVTLPATPDYNTVVTQNVTVSLKAGSSNTIVFSNPGNTSFNVDRIVV
ncbi:discoidin domain-containing protein [Dactylosporangium darangshiense]|uniref:Discoidin domain-containing protein n=1 Tax=Dactylosporangium darangshiense TaxID=579108 RepID=A0ABP8DD13_9ACTN